ncbi:hypothetical protein DY000_02008303 [Brassica cretica]|uniref:Uncharacterized protein n=1 Tax=Brassica cretica TaxID=69181 RepID=A0ABQ7CJ85_BRACR|nr:hypothetical protein DY000_02008303 [Brassica cretica]
MTSRRINDPGIIAACHCGAEYETEYSASIETHTATSIDNAHQISTNTPKEESVDSIPTMATHTMHTKEKSPSIDNYGSTSIDTQPQQPNHFRVTTDKAYFPSIDTNVDATRDGDYSIGSWADNHYHESYAVETAYCDQGDDELNEGFTYEELLIMQKRDETDQNRAATAWERTRFSHPIDKESRPLIDTSHSQSIDINSTTLIDIRPIPKTTISEKDKFDNQYLTPDEFGIFRDPDGYARAIYGRTLHVSREDIANILQTANGADNLFIHKRSIPEQQQKATKEIYDTVGGMDKSFKQRTRHPTQPSIDVDVPTSGYARDLDGHTIPVHNRDIRRILERASRDEPSYICLPKHASSFTQTKLVPEIYTKDEINEMFYGVCGEHEKNKEAFQMKLDGVYYPLNDSISWLATCMEEMKQDIARFQSASDVARPTSIDNHLHTSIDSGLRTSIDNRISASVDANPPHSHSIKSQPDFHTRAEIDQIVEGIYRALESTEERLDGRCDDIYFPMDLSISALTSKIEAIQRELVEIQSYIARRREASPSIDRRNNKSTDIHQQISVDKASNQGRLAQMITSNMSDTHNHEEDISADTYARLIRHQFNLESLGDRLQKIEDATTIMEDKWRRGDEAMRDFTNSTKDNKVDQPVNYVTLGEIV